jgi:DNA-directed RNA polymerase subunit RPC12/RpoP
MSTKLEYKCAHCDRDFPEQYLAWHRARPRNYFGAKAKEGDKRYSMLRCSKCKLYSPVKWEEPTK